MGLLKRSLGTLLLSSMLFTALMPAGNALDESWGE